MDNKTTLISVNEAKNLIFNEAESFGTEWVDLEEANGRILAENIYAKSNFPPFDRVTMDGFALKYIENKESYEIEDIQFAGEKAKTLKTEGCIEIMTGSILPMGCDTVVPYEDVKIKDGKIILERKLKQGQNIHKKGSDKKLGSLLQKHPFKINAALISVLLSNSNTRVLVEKNPKICVISTGDELVDVNVERKEFQVIRTNDTLISTLLSDKNIISDKMFLNDDFDKKQITPLLEKYDLLIFSGGVSKGKKDRVTEVLSEAGVNKIFHGLAQRPGKPMYFGKHNKTIVFGLPGNPVSSFTNFNFYILPFLYSCFGLKEIIELATLEEDVDFEPYLDLILTVKLINKDGCLQARKITTNGSGDYSNMAEVDAFVHLPKTKNKTYVAGEKFRIFRM